MHGTTVHSASDSGVTVKSGLGVVQSVENGAVR